jgi:cobalamin biosynthesis protein CobT
MKQVNVLTMYELHRYLSAAAQEAGLSLVKSDKPYSYVKGKVVYLAPEADPISHEKAVRNLRRVINQMAHYTDSDQEYIAEHPLKEDSILRKVFESFEDQRMEYVQSSRYDGDADILDAGTAQDIGAALKIAEDANRKGIGNEDSDKFIALLKAERDLRSEHQPSCIEHDLKLTPKQEEYYEQVMKHAPELRRIRKLEGKDATRQVYELAKQVFEELGGDPEEEEKLGKQPGKGGDEKKPGDPKSGEGEDKGDPKAGEGKELMEKMDIRPSEEEAKENSEKKGTPGGYGSRGHGHVTPATPNDYYVRNFANPAQNKKCSGFDAPIMPSDYTYMSVADVRNRASSSEQLAQRMRRLVQIKMRARTQYGLKEGKLHGNSLHRIIMNKPGYSERVFKRKEDKLEMNAAVGVCLDFSGSMSGDKVNHAIAAAEMLSETVGNALGVPLQVYAFSEHGSGYSRAPDPCIYVLRDYNERFVPTDKLRSRACVAVNETMGNNPDGDAVVWGYHQLRQARGKRKVLFVMSDGHPATYRSGDQGAYLKRVCGLIEASPIRLFGLGLMSHAVEEFYTRRAVVWSAAEIESRLLELVDNFILEGK